MKKTTCLAVFLTFTNIALAENDRQQTNDDHSWLNIAQVEVRADWQRDYIDGNKNGENSGFKGQYINLILKGNISSKVSYAYRQRFSKSFSSSGLFDATDWVYVTYRPNDSWAFSGGKQTVAIGGFEYDYAPIDIYQYSEYCNNIGCYQFGVSAEYNINSSNQVLAQICQSPFRFNAPDMYGYNLKWTGVHGAYSNIWSLSMHEYMPEHYINYIAIGNRVDFSKGHFLFDITNRYSGGYEADFLGDFTITSELHIQPVKELNLFAKYGYDKNDDNRGDYCVFAGTEQHHLGIGLEYFPIDGRKDLRIHANFFHTWGENTNPDGVLQDKQSTFNLGVTWRADLLRFKK